MKVLFNGIIDEMKFLQDKYSKKDEEINNEVAKPIESQPKESTTEEETDQEDQESKS